jgi:hypothetical protein
VARGGNPYARRDPERAPKHRRAGRLREPLFESRSGEVRQRCQPRRVTARNAASARATLPRPRTAAVEAGRSDCDAGANLRSARRAADLTAFPGRNGPAVATHGTSPVSIGASACAHVAVAGPVAMTICLCFWLHQPLGAVVGGGRGSPLDGRARARALGAVRSGRCGCLRRSAPSAVSGGRARCRAAGRSSNVETETETVRKKMPLSPVDVEGGSCGGRYREPSYGRAGDPCAWARGASPISVAPLSRR